jgi:hypothetical protein
VRRWGLLAAAVALALFGCGDDQQPFVEPAPSSKPADLVGTWEATRPGGYKLRYVFRRDGTYAHSSGQRQKRASGTYRYRISNSGVMVVRGRTLVLTPRAGTIERHDPGDPRGDFKRRYPRRKQRYEWSLRGSGRQARLTLTIGGALAVTYRRR